jgi:phospholipase C
MGNSCFKTTPESKVVINGNIKTVVITVMENRSFDNLLGFLNRVHPTNDVNGLTGDEYNLINVSDPNSQKVTVTDSEPYVTEADPDHGFAAIRFQVFGSDTDTSANPPPMSGFAQNAEGVKAGFSPQVSRHFYLTQLNQSSRVRKLVIFLVTLRRLIAH